MITAVMLIATFAATGDDYVIDYEMSVSDCETVLETISKDGYVFHCVKEVWTFDPDTMMRLD